MIRFMQIVISCLLLTICSTSCDLSKPEDVNKAQIGQILDQIQIDFRQLDLPGIMSFYAPDYLHNGTGLSVEQTKWQQRMSKYSSFEFTNLHYDINKDYAVVSGTAKWVIALQDEVSSEPLDNGDFSYFIKVDGTWRIYGNHKILGQ